MGFDRFVRAGAFVVSIAAQGAVNAAGAQGSHGVLYTLVGETLGDRFGAAVAGLGDLDGDGRGDFAVGAPRAAPNGPASGSVRVFSGRGGGLLYRLDGGSAAEQFGAALAGVGDVNGDGAPDLAVGAPRHGSSRGRVQVFSGRDGALLWTWSGGTPGARFGQALSGVGDVNGDGHADVAVGAPFSSSGGIAAGRVEVYSGATGEVLHVFEGQAFDLFGSAVAAAGDFDGDGYADLWIGAPLSDIALFNAGSAFLRSGRDGSLLAAIHGSVVGQQLGQWLASAGDFDGDGRPDGLLAAPGDHGGGILAGAVEVRSGSSGALLLRIVGHESGVQMGPVANLGDLNGDQRDDFLLGAPLSPSSGPGRALVVRGPRPNQRSVLHGSRPNDWFGAALAKLGDVNGDGRPDFAVGAPGHEDTPAGRRGYVRVYSGRAFAGD